MSEPYQVVRRGKDNVRFEVANRLFFRLYQASNLMHKSGSRSLAKFSSTTQQWAVLGALSRPAVRKHGMTVKELIEFLLTSRQNLTAVLNSRTDHYLRLLYTRAGWLLERGVFDALPPF